MLNVEGPNFSQAPVSRITIDLPAWVDSIVDWNRTYSTDREKMALAIELSFQNIKEQTGGPFGAAIFDRNSGELIGVGVNRVVPLCSSALHGEIVAIMMAQNRLKSFTLGSPNSVRELFTSCEPCAQCLGGVLRSGVKRMVCAATGDDARAIGFDEGPVFPESYAYLEKAGIEVVRNFARPQAQNILKFYGESGGKIYNGDAVTE